MIRDFFRTSPFRTLCAKISAVHLIKLFFNVKALFTLKNTPIHCMRSVYDYLSFIKYTADLLFMSMQGGGMEIFLCLTAEN